jgi:lipopolysaccharide heptosyltransferase I
VRVLIVKTSSMGDLIHTLPAVTDAARAIAGIRFDWVAEEAFAEIPPWHPAVDRVIPIALRRWRKTPCAAGTSKEIAKAVAELRVTDYDRIIDAQGLIKSAMVNYLARGRRCGMDRRSCREPLAALAYQQRCFVVKTLHAIDRVRILFADALGYSVQHERLDYGIDRTLFEKPNLYQPYVVFLHASSGPAKLWAVSNWAELVRHAEQAGFSVYLPWGNQMEYERAEAIAAAGASAEVLPRMRLHELACVLAYAAGVIGVDTGLAHLAAALQVPGVTLYTATSPDLTGTLGPRQTCLKPANIAGKRAVGEKPSAGREKGGADRFGTLSVEAVWSCLQSNMNKTVSHPL